jgi:hypothetical protein
LGATYPPPKPLKRQENPFTLILERVLNQSTAKKIGRAEFLKNFKKIPLVSKSKNSVFQKMRFKGVFSVVFGLGGMFIPFCF